MSGNDIDEFIAQIGRINGTGTFVDPDDKSVSPIQTDAGYHNSSKLPED